MNSLKLGMAIAAVLGMNSCAIAHEHGEADVLPNKFVPAGTAPDVANPFHPIRLILASDETAGELSLFEFEVPAQSAGSPPHTHTLEDEYFFILSGTLDVLVDGEVSQLGEGDFAALTRGHTHMFWNGSDQPVRLLMATTGASFETFMSSVAPRLAEAKPDGPQAAGAVVGALAAEHGITITMEDMPEEAAPYYQ